MKQKRNLITERKLHKLTQKQAAERIGVTTRQYQNLEAGTSDGSMKVWRKLSDLFDQPIDYLLAQVDTTIVPQNNETNDTI